MTDARVLLASPFLHPRIVESTGKFVDSFQRPEIFSKRYNKTMWAKLLFSAVLFYAFVPGVLLNLSTPFTSPALTHAILFALVSGFVWKAAKPFLPKY